MALLHYCSCSAPPSPPPPLLQFKKLTSNSLFFTVPALRRRFGQNRRLSPTLNASLAVESPSTSGEDRGGDSPKLLLEVNSLSAVIAESKQPILKGVDLVIYEGEVHAIMGKNGSGKSTFAKVLVGHPDYEVTGGSVVFKGENVLEMDPEERSLAGIFMSFQSPVEIPGVSNIDFLNMAYNARRRKLGLPELGPIEVLGAELAMLDEIDSGLDVDALQDVAKAVNGLLTPKNSVLMITHYHRLLEFIKPNYVHIMENGRIVETGDVSVAKRVEKEGYKAMSTT
ncbi:hypothetical protein CsSME_00042532 [Camellia sinensis var. sinensis]